MKTIGVLFLMLFFINWYMQIYKIGEYSGRIDAFDNSVAHNFITYRHAVIKYDFHAKDESDEEINDWHRYISDDDVEDDDDDMSSDDEDDDDVDSAITAGLDEDDLEFANELEKDMDLAGMDLDDEDEEDDDDDEYDDDDLDSDYDDDDFDDNFDDDDDDDL